MLDLKDQYGMNAMEFHDMDFFVREKRTAEFAERLIGQDIQWWGLGRVDTLMGLQRRHMGQNGKEWSQDGIYGCRKWR